MPLPTATFSLKDLPLINKRIENIQPSASIQMADLARQLSRKGKKIIKLQTGDPDFPPPPGVEQFIKESMQGGQTHYVESRGLPELREGIAAKLEKENGIKADPEKEILVTVGAAHALFIALQTILSPGDEVLLFEPYYISYISAIHLAGGIPRIVPGDPDSFFVPCLEKMENFVSNRTKVLLLNSPANPSGYVLPVNALRYLADFAKKYDLIVLSDEVYENLFYTRDAPISIGSISEMRERCITVNSFSKTYAMPGFRLGYLHGPTHLVKEMLKVLQFSVTCVPPFIQSVGAKILANQACQNYRETLRIQFSERCAKGTGLVRQQGLLRLVPPQGAFYFFLDVTPKGLSSDEFVLTLLERFEVATVAGTAYGQNCNGWIRVSYAINEVDFLEGLQRIHDFVRGKNGTGGIV